MLYKISNLQDFRQDFSENVQLILYSKNKILQIFTFLNIDESRSSLNFYFMCNASKSMPAPCSVGFLKN